AVEPGWQPWVAAVAGDLQAHRGRSLVVPGAYAAPALHALAHAMNDGLGNIGQTVTFIPPVQGRPADRAGTLRELVEDMRRGTGTMSSILSGNPVYTAPVDLDFAAALAKVPLRVHLGLYVDETAWLSHWHFPEAHFLESWSDTRAYDGTVSIIQPLIA